MVEFVTMCDLLKDTLSLFASIFPLKEENNLSNVEKISGPNISLSKKVIWQRREDVQAGGKTMVNLM